MTLHVVWLRNDLRIHDNAALYAACRDPQAQVRALFIATPQQWQQHAMSPRQAAFIKASLEELAEALAERGIPFDYHQCDTFQDAVDYLDSYCQRLDVDALFYNYQYEINEHQRDVQMERRLDDAGVIVQGFDDSVLLSPGSVRTGSGEMYKVFTPFSKAVVKRLQAALPDCYAAPKKRPGAPAKAARISPFDYPTQPLDLTLFPPGEQAALVRLREFCLQPVVDYATRRDFPALDSTSRLSAYLATGVLSPRQCLHRLLHEHPQGLEETRAFVWLNEIIWREFYRHLMVAWPHLCKHQPFVEWTANLQWQGSEAQLNQWQQGQTGYPIVDAGMRQLLSLGWMHNRLRMIVASFLVKDLLIDWRQGEQWFMSQLVDGDLAANNGGWQWAASTGTDAAPYFRIFNPTTQGERFDKEGDFIRQWVPELRDVPAEGIHQPHVWAKKQGIKLHYPEPMVDHKVARKQTLAAFEAAKDPR
ncbi:deoxyribodipyrimidine photo-lyase [Enterobacterales bacterium CwR94]|nr:deoxyribodipyrimidine photo-lyase [Enterobacterales bacterium CwR94]